ncbi:uncharacterized protein LOC124917399 [Impatiens glandulifera]|uniref:uncharacterized protein LOC124917399 n=1 Tax=Impatiens glandulifera TaxID=253017 RepID=UPI001FB14288|nr:uncharacterized protein LOC124917399 [Impatiens glandulifera]
MGSTFKVDIEKFDVAKEFGLWNMKMRAHLGKCELLKNSRGDLNYQPRWTRRKRWRCWKRPITLILSLDDKGFFKFRMTKEKHLQTHLDDYVKILLNLENIGDKYKDEDKALMILNFLLKSYTTFVDIIEHEREELTLDDVMSALRSKDQKKKNE